jgi:hypothetical protein
MSQSASNAEESQHSRQPTPMNAVLNLDGSIQSVRAHNVVRFRLTNGLLSFALHATILFVALVIGAVLLFLNMHDTAATPFQIGGFLPAPKHKDETAQSDSDTATNRAHQVSSAAQYVATIV